jgi:hypothetical protein
MAKYDIYEKDGVLFRGWADAGFVNEVMTSEGWRPYAGDGRAPVAFGDHVRAEEAESNRQAVRGRCGDTVATARNIVRSSLGELFLQIRVATVSRQILVLSLSSAAHECQLLP